MLKGILILFGAFAGLIALVAIIGAMLPVKHVATQSADYGKPPDAVWATITDPTKFAAWRPNMKTATPADPADPRRGWTEIWSHGEQVPITVEEWTPPRKLVTRLGPGMAFGGTWTFELAPTPAGTRLRITENGEVYNPIFRFLSRFVFGHTASMRDYLKGLGKAFGEETQVAG
ncbi:MAG TPA: SRPBCC family protein [Candidatus Acidoferrales bacterium]|nr:SRPBCC family protein [Candidatus Acidoferrales bacterium]